MKHKSLITLLLAAAVACPSFAVPAKRELRTFTQPDGSRVAVTLCGDERLHWFESPDGTKLLRNEAGYLTYATVNADGDLVASGTVYRQDGPTAAFARDVATGGGKATFSDRQLRAAAARAPRSFEDHQIFPTEGKRNLLMLLVNFSDTEPTRTSEEIGRMMNEEGYNGIGSFKDYMLEASCGKLDIDVTVTDWLTLDQEHDYFYFNDRTDNAEVMVYYALQKADEEIDFSKFDNNGDGVVDGLMVLHQGFGQESTMDENDIWSHSSNLSYFYSERMRTFDGVLVDAYTIEPELIYLSDVLSINSTIGVFCHEFMHNLGAMDYYDSDYEGSGGEFRSTGAWDILAGGSWNGYYGDRPAMVNAYQRILFGWLPEPVKLTDDTEVRGLANILESQRTYRIDTGDDYDYFLLENRQEMSSPFEQGLPGSGLIIYHVNEQFYEKYYDWNELNASAEQSVYVVDAAAGKNPGTTPNSFGNTSLGTSAYGNEVGGFNDYSLPSPVSWRGESTGAGLYDIVNNADGLVDFDYATDRTVEIKSASARSQDGNIYLSWDAPEVDGGTVKGYNFYIKTNGVMNNRGLQKKTTLTLYAIPQGLNEYGVTIVYGNGEESEMAQFSLYIPKECLTSASATRGGDGITVSWTEDNQIKEASASPFVEYRVYRNKTLIGTTTGTSFTDSEPTGDDDTYSVKSYWEGDVELPGLTAQLSNGVAETSGDNGLTVAALTFDKGSGMLKCLIDCGSTDAEVAIDIFDTLGQSIATTRAVCGSGINAVDVNLSGANDCNGVLVVKVAMMSAQGTSIVTRKVAAL